MADVWKKITEIMGGSKALAMFGAGSRKQKKYVQTSKVTQGNQQKGKPAGRTVQKAGGTSYKGSPSVQKKELTPEEKARLQKARAEKARLEKERIEKERLEKERLEKMEQGKKEIPAEKEPVKKGKETAEAATMVTEEPKPETGKIAATVEEKKTEAVVAEEPKPEAAEEKEEPKSEVAEKPVAVRKTSITPYQNWNTNKVILTGTFITEFTFGLERKGARIYTAEFAVKRTSGVEDKIQISAEEELLDLNAVYTGRRATIEGQFRSRNSRMTDKTLILYAFAKKIELLEPEELAMDENSVSLQGYICKPPVYRKTPMGRVICDVLVGVNRTYKKTDYIPCIFWRDNAEYIKDCSVGTELSLEGRIQSREYVKKNGETEETMTAYEISVNVVEKREKNKKSC